MSVLLEGGATAPALNQIAPLLGPFAVGAGETGVSNVSYPRGAFERYGAAGDGVTDDAAAIAAAIAANPGGRVFGAAGRTYVTNAVITPPSTSTVIDLTDATLRPTNAAQMFHKAVTAPSLTLAVVSGATRGSRLVTLASVAGLAVNNVVTFTTDAGALPFSWSKVVGINAGTKVVTLDGVLTFTYPGNVSLNVQPLYGDLEIIGGTVDLSLIAGAASAVIDLAGFNSVRVRGLTFKGPYASLTVAGGIMLAQCRRAYIEDCSCENVVFFAQAFGISGAKYARIARAHIDGDCFGTFTYQCDFDQQTEIVYSGRRASVADYSVRAVKSTFNRHSLVSDVQARDCETVLEYADNGRGSISNIQGVNIGLTPYVGQTAVTIASSTANGSQTGINVAGINLENCGGIGLQVMGDSTGAIVIDDFNIKDTGADAIILNARNVVVGKGVVQNWDTAAVGGATAGIRSGEASALAALVFGDVVFVHTDNTKPCFSLANGPRYSIRAIPISGNPLYELVTGRDQGGIGNQSFGGLASVRRDGTVTTIPHVGTQFTFPVGAGKTFTFTVQEYGKLIVFTLGGGQSCLALGDASPAIQIVAQDASGTFVLGAPGANKIGLTVTGSRQVNVTNGFGGVSNISVCVLGGMVTATTDPV